MRLVVVGLLILAVVVAGGAAILLRNILASQEGQQVEKVESVETVNVLVAKQDLPPGSAVTLDGAEWREWPEDLSNPNYVTETEEFDFKKEFSETVVRHAISKGEPISYNKLFKNDSPGFLAGTITPGMRVISIAVNAVSGAQGFIFPGDRVDLILTHGIVSFVIKERQEEESASETPIVVQTTSETFLRNLRVIAIDQQVSEFESQAQLVQTVALEVTPKQAEIIQTAKQMGKVSLVLRSLAPGDGEGEADAGMGTYTTDVEVSPMLRNLNQIIEARDKAREVREVLLQKTAPLQTSAPMIQQPTSEPIVVEEVKEVEKPKSAPVEEKPSKPIIRVYRGGKGSIEEIGGPSTEETKSGK